MATKSGDVNLNVDIDLLKKQKRLLLRLIDKYEAESDERNASLLDGLLNTLDHIHDTLDPPAPVR